MLSAFGASPFSFFQKPFLFFSKKALDKSTLLLYNKRVRVFLNAYVT